MSLLNINQHGGADGGAAECFNATAGALCCGWAPCSRRIRNRGQEDGGESEVTRLSGDQEAMKSDTGAVAGAGASASAGGGGGAAAEDDTLRLSPAETLPPPMPAETPSNAGSTPPPMSDIIPRPESGELMSPWSEDLQRAIREARQRGGYWKTTVTKVNLSMCIPGFSDCLGPLLGILNTFSQQKSFYASVNRRVINRQLNHILLYLDTKITTCSQKDYPTSKNFMFSNFAEKNTENIEYWCQTVVREYGEQLKMAYTTGNLIGGYENYDSRMKEYISKLITEPSDDEFVNKHILLSLLNQYFETDIIQAGYVYEGVKMMHNDSINGTDEAGEAQRTSFFSEAQIYGTFVGGKRRKKKSNKKKRKITNKNNKKKRKVTKKNNKKKTKKRKKYRND